MKHGKFAAQVSHAAMAFLTRQIKEGHRGNQPVLYGDGNSSVLINIWAPEYQWIQESYVKVVLAAKDEQELREVMDAGKAAGLEVHGIIDEGRTVFNGVPTLTCASFGPDENEKIDKVTGHLPLY